MHRSKTSVVRLTACSLAAPPLHHTHRPAAALSVVITRPQAHSARAPRGSDGWRGAAEEAISGHRSSVRMRHRPQRLSSLACCGGGRRDLVRRCHSRPLRVGGSPRLH